MKMKTVQGLNQEKLMDLKARLFEAYRFSNIVEFETVWQKCIIAIGKACQGLRSKTVSVSMCT
jgi:hypothetical protein